jgi:hypothetical protein
MRKENFEAFLNKWDLTEARYGGAILEFVEQDGELKPSVLPWNKTMTDTVDFENNPKVKILELTPAQLRKNKLYDQEKVKELLEALTARETTGKQKKDSKSEYIKLYEIHGELEECYLTENEDDEDFVQQIQVVSFVGKKGKRGEYDDFILYRGKEKDPHMMTKLLEEDGRAMPVGAVENLFDAQWTDITAIQNFNTQWQVLGKEVNNTPDAIAGNTQPSGTPFRSVAIQNQEAHSLFEVMKKSKKRSIQEMCRRFIIPFVKKQLDSSEEIAAILESQDINMLDQMYVPNEANKRDNEQLKKTILSNLDREATDIEGIAQNLDRPALEADIKGELNMQGNQRFVKPSEIPDKTWKEVLKDLEWDVEYEIVDKYTDDQIVAQTLVDFFKILVDPNAQAFIDTPKGKLLFNKILDKTNAVSPLELASVPNNPPLPPAAPSPQGSPVGASPAGQPLNTGQPNA